MAYLDQIIVICKKKSREESGRAIRGVVEWWRGGGGDGGGSPSRKLKAFADQPGLAALGQAWEASAKGKAAVTDLTQAEMERCLVIWAFEDWLKKWFFQVLQALEVSASWLVCIWSTNMNFDTAANVCRPATSPADAGRGSLVQSAAGQARARGQHSSLVSQQAGTLLHSVLC